METILINIYQYFNQHKKILYGIFIGSFLVLLYFAANIKLEEDISKILPKDKSVEKMNKVLQQSKFIDKMVVMISLKDTSAASQPDSLTAYAEQFSTQVKSKLAPLIDKVNDKVDDSSVMNLYHTINQFLPVYLDDDDYKKIDTLIEPDHIKSTLSQNIRTLSSPAGIALKEMISNDPVGISFLGLKKMQHLQYDKSFELYDNYIVTKDYKNLLLFITPAYPSGNTLKNAQLIKGLDSIISQLNGTDFKNIEANYFGSTAVSVSNALQLRTDTMYTQGITVIFIVLFLAIYFRKKRAPFIILLPVLYGCLFSLTCIYFIKGSISVIALGTGSVVLGIAVNYSLHVFNHNRHINNVSQVVKDLSMPLTIGSFTTIGGFFCLYFLQSELLKDLGLFAAFSLIGASFCSLVFLPHFLGSYEDIPQKDIIRFAWIDKISSLRPEYNKYVILVILILTIVFAYTAQRVGFETDLMDMSFMSQKLKIAEKKLNKLNTVALQSVYLVTEGNNLDAALASTEKLDVTVDSMKEKGIIKKYSGVSSLIFSDSLQNIRIEKWNKYWTPEKKKQLFTTLESEGKLQGYSAGAFVKFNEMMNTQYQKMDVQKMYELKNNFLSDFITEKNGHSTIVSIAEIAPENKNYIYKNFENDSTVTVVDKQLLTSKLINTINNDFTNIALLTSSLVFIVLLLTYGRIELTMISFIPMCISFIWILGIMGIFNIQFNIINIVISALIFGLGDDYSLFIMDGLLQEYKTGKKNLVSYKSSIFLSAITTVAGLGVLIFAKHPALKSIALISIIGMICVVVIAQILIPYLFAVIIKKRADKKLYPWTILGFIRSVFAFAVFIIGSILLTILGLFLVKLNPFYKEKSKYIFHFILSKYAWGLVYLMGNIKKEIINPLCESFSKPAIIISNHLSSLDILLMAMLHPKIIMLTNKWVWNSPIFGFVVRMADYYPVTEEGADAALNLLKSRVQQGYSIVVFPEGTRSKDGIMKRFHKGAFYLAEKLNLDILPIVIHGSNYTAKDDFMLRNGKLTVKFLPRIKQSDIEFGNNYSERTKKISRYFKEEYRALKTNMEVPAYFRQKLIYNYLYKGPIIEWYLKIKLKLEKNYRPIYELIPKEGKLLDIGCGYGFMSFMLHFASPALNITGIDYDDEKTELANRCFSKDDSIQFIHEDIMNFNFEKYDAIILADMLHYLQAKEQQKLIATCLENIQPNGVIIIREGNKNLIKRHSRTRFSEFLSTKVFGFNKTSNAELNFLSTEMIKEMAEKYLMEYEEIDNAKFMSNMLFVITNKKNIHETI